MSKSPGGSKRVTSLADALKLNFGIITTSRRRELSNSTLLDRNASAFLDGMIDAHPASNHSPPVEAQAETQANHAEEMENGYLSRRNSTRARPQSNGTFPTFSPVQRPVNGYTSLSSKSSRVDFASSSSPRMATQQDSSSTGNVSVTAVDGSAADEYTDERARDVITGRLIQGHIVDDGYPSPSLSTMSSSVAAIPPDPLGASQFLDRDLMTASFFSNYSADHPLGGSFDAGAASDAEEEELKNPELEHTITLVGNVRDKVVLIIDDMIDQCGSWIAAAETVVKMGGAQKVYCMATHGLFGDDSLEMMENCQCIDFIVVTNSYPIAPERIKASKKLVLLDISNLLAEAIKRNHYGESISQLYQHYPD